MNDKQNRQLADLQRMTALTHVMDSGQVGILKYLFEMENSFNKLLTQQQAIIDSKTGLDGYTPVKGEDYFTVAELEALSQEIFNTLRDEVKKLIILPKSGKDYPSFTQVSALINKEIESIRLGLPEPIQKGKDYFTPEEIAQIKADIVEKIKKDVVENIGPTAVDYINSSEGEKKIDVKAIKNLPGNTRTIVERTGGFVETPIVAGSNVTVSKNASGAWVITSTGGGGAGYTKEDLTSQVDGVNDVFTVTAEPKQLFADGILKRNAGVDYTFFDFGGDVYGVVFNEEAIPQVSLFNFY